MSYMAVDKAALIKDLKQFVAEVQFTKRDGERRVMKCTLQRNYLPAEYQDRVDEQIHSDPHPHNLIVWDVEFKGWRSIPLDRVFSTQQIDGW